MSCDFDTIGKKQIDDANKTQRLTYQYFHINMLFIKNLK